MSCFEKPTFVLLILLTIFASGLEQSIIFFPAIPQDCSSVFQFIKLGRL